MTGHKGKECNWSITFEYENTRSDFKCCDYWKKWKTIRQITAKYTWDPRAVTPDIDGFTDEPVVQCDVLVENTFVDDSR